MLFFDIDSILPLPVGLPCRAALAVELDRDARVAPVAGAVLILPPMRSPLPGAVLGAAVMATRAPLFLVVAPARAAAPPDCAKAVVMPAASAASKRSFFIKNKRKKREVNHAILRRFGPYRWRKNSLPGLSTTF